MTLIQTLGLATLLAAAGIAQAHGDAAHPTPAAVAVKKEQKAWGIAGDAKAARRTIEVKMLDSSVSAPIGSRSGRARRSASSYATTAR